MIIKTLDKGNLHIDKTDVLWSIYCKDGYTGWNGRPYQIILEIKNQQYVLEELSHIELETYPIRYIDDYDYYHRDIDSRLRYYSEHMFNYKRDFKNSKLKCRKAKYLEIYKRYSKEYYKAEKELKDHKKRKELEEEIYSEKYNRVEEINNKKIEEFKKKIEHYENLISEGLK